MSQEIEIEKTYLAKYLPAGLKKCQSKQIKDIYLPKNSRHAKLRIRQSGSNFTITKKSSLDSGTAGIQLEENITISVSEFRALAGVNGNKVVKTRYYFPYKGKIAEIDIFSGRHAGLVLVDFEFKNRKEFEHFSLPDFCLADVTEEEIIAGGYLCRQSQSTLKRALSKFGYTKLYI